MTEIERELDVLIRARYPILYIVSYEETRVERTLQRIARRSHKEVITWTVTDGFSDGGRPTRRPQKKASQTVEVEQALEALDYVLEWRGSTDPHAPRGVLFVLKDFDPYISAPAVERKLRDVAQALKTSLKTLIILSPVLKVPSHLEKDITVIDYPLPNYEELKAILENLVRHVEKSPHVRIDLDEPDRELFVKAALGLTAAEAENVFAKALVMDGKLERMDAQVVLSEKKQIIRKSETLEYYESDARFADIGGMDALKEWLRKRKRSFTEKARAFGLPEPRGVLLIGVQGCGKSLAAKAVSALWELPLLRFDIGTVFGKYVGESEARMRHAIRVAEGVAPCLTGDTVIPLADGREMTLREIYEQQENSFTVPALSEDLKQTATKVLAITRRPCPNDLYEMTFFHTKIKATGNHRFPVLRQGKVEWVRADELTRDDYVAAPRILPTGSHVPARLELPPDETRLYGQQLFASFDRYPADFCPPNIHSLPRSCTEPTLLREAERIIVSTFGGQPLVVPLNHEQSTTLASLVENMNVWVSAHQPSVPESLESLRRFVDSDVVWTRIRSIRRIPPEDYVYDLCCEGPYNFVANGVFTHNCVLWIDELEKGFSGMTGGEDSGTSARVLASFLTWLQEKTAPVFVIATANDVHKLPPELLRKGRLDEIFFIDLPAQSEREEIFAIHLRKRGRDPAKFDIPKLAKAAEGYSGSEIEQAIIGALYDAFDEDRDITDEDILRNIKVTVPISRTMRERIEALRAWAHERARNASTLSK
ncbi:MAG TPA: AAA family ATPase [Armatimonadetes bacterium]|nr:AAA family ATPase [Armatimonadota bacterium]